MQEYPKGSLLPSSWERRRSTTSGTGWGGAILGAVADEEGWDEAFPLLYGVHQSTTCAFIFVTEMLSQLVQDKHSYIYIL